ncbi:MAG: hypothetical protein NTX49_10420 [Chlamydiae bacterium]|nr:hypothetical protein [Chlamydiota bacterium]
MSPITGMGAVAFLHSVEPPRSSIISSQIDIIGRKVTEVITQMERLRELPSIQAERIQKDAPTMLRKLEVDLKDLITPSPLRDSLWIHFDEENRRIDLDEDAVGEEIDRAQALKKIISNCGFALPEKVNIQTYQKLAYQAEKVWKFVNRMKGEMGSFSESFAKQAKFSSELEYLQDAVLRLRRKVNILCRCMKIHKSDGANSFTLDAHERFINLANRANEVGFETIRAICQAGAVEEDKLIDVSTAPNPLIHQTIRAIENNAFEILCAIQENGVILSSSVKGL